MSDVEKVARAMWGAIEARRHAPFGPKYKDYDDLAAQAAAKPYDWAWKEMQGLTAMAEAALAAMGEREDVGYTEGHCAENRKPGGCQLHNLYCGYPDCDRKPIDEAVASPRPEAVEEIAAIAESLRHAYPMEASRILILLGKAQPAAIMATAEPPAPTPLKPSTPDRR